MDTRPVLVRIVSALYVASSQGMPFKSISLVLGKEANEKLTKELETLAALTGGFPVIYTYEQFVGIPKISRTDVDPNTVMIKCAEVHA